MSSFLFLLATTVILAAASDGWLRRQPTRRAVRLTVSCRRFRIRLPRQPWS